MHGISDSRESKIGANVSINAQDRGPLGPKASEMIKSGRAQVHCLTVMAYSLPYR